MLEDLQLQKSTNSSLCSLTHGDWYCSFYCWVGFACFLQSLIGLGYGLVEVPRRLWKIRDEKDNWEQMYGLALENYNELEEAIDRIMDARSCVAMLSHRVDAEHVPDMVSLIRQVLWKYVADVISLLDNIERKIPNKFTDHTPIQTSNAITAAFKNIPVSIDTIAKLHRIVKVELNEIRRARYEWESCYRKISDLEDLAPENSDDIAFLSGARKGFVNSFCPLIVV